MTIRDYFHNRTTPGKIGTIFGLLVSGAGSGLAHQQNAALDLINKELDRDLEGQKLSQGNAQNWFKLSMEHARNQALNAKTMAEVPYTEAQTRLSIAQARLQSALESKVPADIQRALAEVDSARIASVKTAADADLQNRKNKILNADTTLTKEAKNRAMIGVSQDIQNQIDQMQPGPRKDKAQQYHDSLIAPGVGAEVTKNNKDISSELLKPNIAPQAAPQAAPEETQQTPPEHIPVKPGDIINQNVFNAFVQQHKDMKLAGTEGRMTERDQEKIKEEVTKAKDIQNMKDSYNKSFRKLNNMFRGSEKFNPAFYASQTAALNALMARSVAGKTILSEMQAQGEGAFPAWNDWGESAEQKYYKTMRMLDDNMNNTETLKRFPELTKGIPKVTYPDPWNHNIFTHSKTGERAYINNKGKMVTIP